MRKALGALALGSRLSEAGALLHRLTGMTIEQIYREESGRILATLIRLLELELRGDLSESYLLPAARGDLLRRMGRWAESVAAYRRALALVTQSAEEQFLARRIAEVEAQISKSGSH